MVYRGREKVEAVRKRKAKSRGIKKEGSGLGKRRGQKLHFCPGEKSSVLRVPKMTLKKVRENSSLGLGKRAVKK